MACSISTGLQNEDAAIPHDSANLVDAATPLDAADVPDAPNRSDRGFAAPDAADVRADASARDSGPPDIAPSSLPVTARLSVRLHARVEVTVDAVGKVTSWADASGANVRFEPDGDDERPTLKHDGFSGRPTVSFTGTDSLDAVGSLGISDQSGRTFVLVARVSNPAARGPLLLQGVYGDDSRHLGIEANTWRGQSGVFGVFSSSCGYDGQIAVDTEPKVHVLVVQRVVQDDYLLDQVDYRVNGRSNQLSPNTRGCNQMWALVDVSTRLCGFPGFSNIRCEAEISEVLVYRRALTSSEVRQLEEHLMLEYGIR